MARGSNLAMPFVYMLSMAVFFCFFVFFTITAELSCDQDHMLAKAEDIYHRGPLQKKFGTLYSRCKYNKNVPLLLNSN